MDVISDFMNKVLWGNTIGDYLASLVIVAVTILAAIIINRYLRNKLLDWADRTNTKLDDFILNRIFPPIVYMIVIIGLAVAVSNLQIEPTATAWINKILLAAGLAVFFLLIIRLLKGLVEMVADAYVGRLEKEGIPNLEEHKKTVDRVRKQVSEILNMILAVLAILTILSNLGVDLKAIWASLGIGGIALVVAVKDPLSNLVGRMYIYSTGIFDEGHFIVFNGYGGTVKQIALFRTYMEVFSDMTTISIPNADFVKGVVQSYYGRTKFMFKWDLDVPYDTSADKIQELLKNLRELVAEKPEINKDWTWIYMSGLDSYSKKVRVWFQASIATWDESLYYGSRMLHEIQLLFESMGLSFAFPTQTVELKTLGSGLDAARPEPVPAVLPERAE